MSEEDDFASLFESSTLAKPLAKGQTVEGVIVRIGPEVALVDVGGKSEAVVDVAELKNADGALEVTVGDRIQATVVSTAGGVTLSRRLARRAATDRQIENAFEAGLPVEGLVQSVVKGGYEVRVGHSRGFCPLSQMDIARTNDPDVHVGKVYAFRIVEYAEGGRNLVLSRRALLDAEQQARAAEVWQSIVPGAVLQGRVASVREYGAFVELGGGVQGLLHASEIGWSRVGDASQALTPGQDLAVKVLRVDNTASGQGAPGAPKISLSVKALLDDPWAAVPQKYAVGQIHSGRVTRHAEFGAFVELEPGVEALAHASTFPPGARNEWRRTTPVGQTATVEILNVDADKRRIGVAVVPEGATRARAAEVSDEEADVRDYAARGEASEGFGSLADKLRGALKPRDRA